MSEETTTTEEMAEIILNNSEKSSEELYKQSFIKKFVERYNKHPTDKELKAWIKWKIIRKEEDYELDRRIR